MIEVAIKDETWVLRSPFSMATGRTMGNSVTYADDRPRAPITAALVRLADHVIDWRNVTSNGEPAPCTLECVVAILRTDDNVKEQIETALRDYVRSGIVH